METSICPSSLTTDPANSPLHHHNITEMFFKSPPPDTRAPLLIHRHFVLPFTLLHLTLVLSARWPYLRILAAPIIIGLYLHPILTATSPVWAVSFFSGVALFYEVLTAVNYLLVVNVYKDERFRQNKTTTETKKISNGTANGHTVAKVKQVARKKDKSPVELSFLQRNLWVQSLLINLRGVGWSFLPAGVAEHRNPSDKVVSEYNSRFRFFAVTLFRAACCYVVMDAFSFLTEYDPYFSTTTCWSTLSPFTANPKTVSMFYDGCYPSEISNFAAYFVDDLSPPHVIIIDKTVKIFWVIFRNLFFSAEIFSVLTTMYDALSIICVCVLRQKPQSWPPLFGPIGPSFVGKNAGLRGFWGRFWHQIFRMQMSLPSEGICRILFGSSNSNTSNGPSKSNGQLDAKIQARQQRSKAIQQQIRVFTTFACSGLLHLSGTSMMGILGLGSFAFFALQPIGLLMEGVILRTLFRSTPEKKARESRLGQLVCVLWMYFWLHLTCGFFIADLVNGGKGDPVDWNVVWSLWRGAKGFLNGGPVLQDRIMRGAEEGWAWGHPSNWVRWDDSLWGWEVAI